MTILEAINRIDDVKPNSFKQTEKIRWLHTLDGIIKSEIIDTHEGGENITLGEYSENTLLQELLVPHPYDDIYIKWLEARIDYANDEYNKYNNTVVVYNQALADYEKYYNRTHKPIQKNFTHF